MRWRNGTRVHSNVHAANFLILFLTGSWVYPSESVVSLFLFCWKKYVFIYKRVCFIYFNFYFYVAYLSEIWIFEISFLKEKEEGEMWWVCMFINLWFYTFFFYYYYFWLFRLLFWWKNYGNKQSLCILIFVMTIIINVYTINGQIG